MVAVVAVVVVVIDVVVFVVVVRALLSMFPLWPRAGEFFHANLWPTRHLKKYSLHKALRAKSLQSLSIWADLLRNDH